MTSPLLDLCEENFLVNLPKRVAIRNLRLGLLLLILRIGAVIWVVYLMYQERPWLRVEVPTGSYAFWTERPDTWLMAKDQHESVVCDHRFRHLYDYQYGADTTYRYTNITCASIIPEERSTRGESQLFIPTFFQELRAETRVPPGASPPGEGGNCSDQCTGLTAPCASRGGTWAPHGVNDLNECVCACMTEGHYFVLGVSSLVVAFEHNALIRWSPSHQASYSSQIQSHQMKTVVRDPSTKEELLTVEPGQTFTMSVGEVLRLAQVSLEQQTTATLPNGLEGDVNQFPVARMTGMVLNAKLTYHNQADEGHDGRHEGPICYVEFEPELIWNSQPRADFGVPNDVSLQEGTLRYRHNYGITIKFTASGTFSTFDAWKLALYLVACAVYLQVPGTIMDIIVTYLLGNLSAIYRNITLPVMTLSAMLPGFLARSLAFKHSFETLISVRRQFEKSEELGKDGSHSGNGSAAEAMLVPYDLDELLREVLSHKEVGDVMRELSDLEVTTLRNLLLGSCGPAGLKEGRFIQQSTDNEGCGEALTFQLFSNWCSSGRSVSPLESAFTSTSDLATGWRQRRWSKVTDIATSAVRDISSEGLCGKALQSNVRGGPEQGPREFLT